MEEYKAQSNQTYMLAAGILELQDVESVAIFKLNIRRNWQPMKLVKQW